MKLIFFYLFLLLLLVSCQSKYNEYTVLQLNGQVKEIITKRYKAVEKFGEVTKGKLVWRSLEDAQEYEYEILPANSRVVFDNNGLMQELTIYSGDNELLSKLLFKDTIFDFYDRRGDLVGKMIGDDRLFPDEMNIYNEEGQLVEKIKVTYDKQAKLNKVLESYDGDGDWLSTTSYTYDKDGRLIKVSTEEKTYSRYYRDRDEKNTIKLETLLYEKGQYPSKVTLEEDGNIEVRDISYTLDDKNNWIESIEYIDGKPKYFIERKLVYY